jgi:hypothetical protein
LLTTFCWHGMRAEYVGLHCRTQRWVQVRVKVYGSGEGVDGSVEEGGDDEGWQH